MKVYEKYDYTLDHPADMEKIMRYLNEHGKLNVHAGTVERLYYEFSDDRASASWLTPDKQILEDFAEWLSCVNL